MVRPVLQKWVAAADVKSGAATDPWGILRLLWSQRGCGGLEEGETGEMRPVRNDTAMEDDGKPALRQ